MTKQTTTKKPSAPRKRARASFGLQSTEIDARKSSIGASDVRIICNGTDEQIERLWREKTGKAAPDDLSDNIHAQFGHFIETFHRMWFEGRANNTIIKVNNRVEGEGELYGSHVTLDGFINKLEPFDTGAEDFELMWTCPKPARAVPAVFEMKWRNGHQFSPDNQTATFLPQIHHAMALTGTDYAVLSTFTSNLKIIARVVKFNDDYWTKVRARVDAFVASVRAETMPQSFPPLNANAATQKTILQTVDMMQTTAANIWTFYAGELIGNQPTPDEKLKLTAIEKAKKELKAVIGKDVGKAHGGGIYTKRDGRGAISFYNDKTDERL